MTNGKNYFPIIVFVTLVVMNLILFASDENQTIRDWEKWDEDNVADIIDKFWKSSESERAHRRTLAQLTQQWVLPNDCVLEVGCGSGLIYNELVPKILANNHYTGVDISEKMLAIAKNEYPQGNFQNDDIYALSFPDNSFDVTICYEVLAHLNGITTPIRELFRVSARTVIFTVWTGEQTIRYPEIIDGKVFIHTVFSRDDILASIATSINGNYKANTIELPNVTAFIITKLH